MTTPTTYYPSLSVKFRIRFDESLHANARVPAPTGNWDLEPGDLTPAVAAPTQTQDLPTILAGQNADQLSQVVSVVPLRCSVELPGYRQASKFEIDLLYSDFPLEPDITRAIGVEIYLGTVEPGFWGAGNTQAPLPGSNTVEAGQTARFSQVVQNAQNLLLYGMVDVHTVEFSDKGFLVKLAGRDLSGIMLDLFCGNKTLPSLNTNKPIDNVVQQIINGVPLLAKLQNSNGAALKVTVNPDEWPGGVVPSPGAAGDWTRVNQGAQGGVPIGGAVPAPGEPNTGARPGTIPQLTGAIPKLKVWDLITQECGLVGAVPYFHGDELRIRPAQVLHDPHKLVYDPQFPTPFANGLPRYVDGYIAPLVIRTLTFGRDIATMKRTRKLGGFKVPAVLCVSVDTSSNQRGRKRFIQAQWPPPVADLSANVSASDSKKAGTTTVAPSGLVAQTDVITISVPGIRSRTRLLEIAKNIYEEVGRCEVGGSCSTKDLASLGGDNADPDMLRLRPGDPVQFTVDNRQLQSYPPPISAVATKYRQDPEALALVLQQKLGGDVNLARVMAYSLTGNIAERQSVYRVNHVRFSWDSRSGIGIDFDFQNYIESRAGITTKNTKPNVQRPQPATKRLQLSTLDLTPVAPAKPSPPPVKLEIPTVDLTFKSLLAQMAAVKKAAGKG